VAAAVVGVQGAVVGVYALVVLVHGARGGRSGLGAVVGIAVLFALWAGGLSLCARGLHLGRRWAWSPSLLCQALILLVCWSEVRNGLVSGYSLVALSALVGLVALVLPGTRAWLKARPPVP
jgi:hypothetical protein